MVHIETEEAYFIHLYASVREYSMHVLIKCLKLYYVFRLSILILTFRIWSQRNNLNNFN